MRYGPAQLIPLVQIGVVTAGSLFAKLGVDGHLKLKGIERREVRSTFRSHFVHSCSSEQKGC